MSDQADSYPCKRCGEVYSEESGAYQGHVCEECEDKELERMLDDFAALGYVKLRREVSK